MRSPHMLKCVHRKWLSSFQALHQHLELRNFGVVPNTGTDGDVASNQDNSLWDNKKKVSTESQRRRFTKEAEKGI